MGQLRQRGNVWWVRYYRDGQRFEESSRSFKKEDARRLLKLREGDIAKGVPVSPAIGRLRFDDAAKDLLNDYSTNGRRSLEHVERRIDLGLKKWFGGRRLSAITTSDVRAYIAHRQEQKASNATINRELAALKRMFSLVVQAGKLMYRPHIPMLQEDNVRKGFFEREQFENVRKHLPAPLKPVATIRLPHGLANQERDPADAMVTDRSEGRDHAPRAWHDEEPGGPNVPLRTDCRTETDARGAVGRA